MESGVKPCPGKKPFLHSKLCGWLSRKKRGKEFVRLFDITGILETLPVQFQTTTVKQISHKESHAFLKISHCI